MRFELVDRVIECSSDRIVAVKAVTAAEEYLADHFPGFPVLPGVLMLEAMAQAGRRLVSHREGNGAGNRLVIAEVRNVKYGRMVRPGQSLLVEVTLREKTDAGYEMAGVGKVDDKTAVQGRFCLAPLA